MGVGLGTAVGVEFLPRGCDDRFFHQDFQKSVRWFSNVRSPAVIFWSILLTLLEKTIAAEKTSNPNNEGKIAIKESKASTFGRSCVDYILVVDYHPTQDDSSLWEFEGPIR